MRDVEIRGPYGITVGDVSQQLTLLAAVGTPLQSRVGGHPEAALWSGSRALPAGALVGGPGLRDGSIVGVNEPGQRDLVAHAILRLHVVCGPDAGLVAAMPRGTIIIGRGPSCDVRLTDPDCSREHLELNVSTGGIAVRDLDSSNGTTLLAQDGSPPVTIDRDGRNLHLEDYVAIGDSIICVAAVTGPAAATRLSDDGRLIVNRPPRLGGTLPIGELALPESPSGGVMDGLPWMAALLPAVGGAGLAWWMHNIQFLAFMVLSPILMLATSLGERVSGRRSRRKQRADFRRLDIDAQAKVAELATCETRSRRYAHPDPASLLHVATAPAARIWERRRADPDFLDVRVGLADQPAWLTLRRGSETPEPPVLRAVPVWTNLRVGPLGVCGPRPLALGVARWAVSQVAALHSPADVAIVALLHDEQAQSWAWLRWLPHIPASGGGSSIARTHDQRQTVLAQLLSRIDVATQRPHQAWTGPWTVLVVDRACALGDSMASVGCCLKAEPSVSPVSVSMRMTGACRRRASRLSGWSVRPGRASVCSSLAEARVDPAPEATATVRSSPPRSTCLPIAWAHCSPTGSHDRWLRWSIPDPRLALPCLTRCACANYSALPIWNPRRWHTDGL